MPRDRRTLRARIGGLAKRGEPDARAVAAVRAAVDASAAERVRRRGLVPAVSYPPELPVTGALDAIRAALAGHQVVVVAGETGSGKSTQLPKLCLELGRGVDGRIAHTQPRRLAARSIGRRVADELGVRVGGGAGSVVGVKVRFNDDTGADTLVKVLTDGMLLAETRGDPRLEEYDTVIVDEAHERSLNIDFLLGYLRRLLPKRPELKVVLTSATIDTARLSAHFGDCPVIEVAGRAYPIDVRFRPPEADGAALKGLDEEDPRLLDALAAAIDEIDATFADPSFAGHLRDGSRPDVLVFLSGEREIREAEAHLRGHLDGHSRGGRGASEILPLFARQAIEEQERIFSPGPARRVVLATNVAETSLTVPRIHAVVDAGNARILRYSARSRVQRLPVEPVSQASARQRAGRAGRLGPGVAVRLYSEEDYLARGEYTPPEILRTNLASVILQMEALRLGKAEEFPFVDPPSARLLADGRATLVELGASTAEGRLTDTGRRMSLLPLDPRLSRMVVASIEERCTPDAVVVAAALAVQDPRIRPAEKRDAADFAHARFQDGASDFASFLRLWRAWREETRELGSSARRRWCESNHLSHQRMREWTDTVSQLRELVAEHFGVRVGEPAAEHEPGAFHRAILAGFASQVGVKTEKGEYRGPTGALFAIHPSSALVRRGPNWIVAAELVETTRRYARICARIQPDWIVRVAPHLCRRSEFEPHYLEETGQVAAWERTVLGELVLVPKRRVAFGPVDPAGARQVFIQEALVAGRARTKGEFLRRNRALRESLEREEARGRRRGLLLEEEAAHAFYDRVVPPEVHSLPSFESWRRAAERRERNLLVMREDDLVRDGAERIEDAHYPLALRLDALEVPIAYAHDPDTAHDGLTARLPVEALAVVDPAPFEWMVPGMLAEKVEALVRSLPKHLRVRLFPIDEVVRGAVEALAFGTGDLRATLAAHLSMVAQTRVSRGDFRTELLPAHLSMRFEVLDADGRTLGEGRDLAALAARFAPVARDRLRASVDRASDPVALLEQDEVEALPDEPLAESIRYARAGIALEGYPALVVEGGAAGGERLALRVLGDQGAAETAHADAVARLVAREQREAVAHHLAYDPSCEALFDAARAWGEPDPSEAVARAVARQSVAEAPRAPRSSAELLAVVRGASRDLHERVAFTVRALHGALGVAAEVERRTRGAAPGDPRATVRERLHDTIPPGAFEAFASCDRDELRQRLRIVEMLLARLERLREHGPAKDRALDEELAPWRARVEAAGRDARRSAAERRAIRRMFEELEISRFAPRLPRAFAASERRLAQLLGDADGAR